MEEQAITDAGYVDVAKRSIPIIRDPEVLLRRGIDLIERNHFEEAAGVLGQAAELAPDYPMVFLAQGIALTRLLRVPEATRALERAAELDPEGFYPRYRLGELYFRIGVPTKAREEMQRALDLAGSAAERRMVREALALDDKRAGKRIWRPDFSLLFRKPRRKR